jgi:CRP/FNR family cyclic AMP-dependent transcriptional regulator
MEEVTSLAQAFLFASLEPDQLAQFAGKLATRNYRQAEITFHKDDHGSVLHIVKSGRGKIVAPSPEGEEVIPAILSTGDFLGELFLLDEGPRSATSVAMAPNQMLLCNH